MPPRCWSERSDYVSEEPRMNQRIALAGALVSGLALFSAFVWAGGDPLVGALGVGAVAVLTLWLN
ncbi:hypothetical protein [Halomarina oriensis]|uniref:Uncharacterized protein n=1 Tax=Halomarina oriensis TaxID=671145 RepID=A0A6B0GMH5_9EURY|nr:hypothetical protein [Halomarina oriensis]MWG36062.1 hypothetical protein [Halomarina oriensis]